MIASYPSSVDPSLRLWAEFHVPERPLPLCLFFHGWHMTAAQSRAAGYIEEFARRFFVVNVDMRGRGASSGLPDASGFELIDGIDALRYALEQWPHAVWRAGGDQPPLYVTGGSGGGGNTLSLAGKAPDLFTAALSWAGISDYALWYKEDRSERGVYRDEMVKWIGGSPADNPGGYRSRGGIHVLENLLTRVWVVHATEDRAVPVEHATRYRDRAASLGRRGVSVHLSPGDHGSKEWVRFIDPFADHDAAPRLPPSGSLLVHGFVACRAFWLVLDDPSRIATVRYTLAPDGSLESIACSPADGSRPAAQALLRVCRPAARARLTDATSSAWIDLPPLEVMPGSRDFRFKAPAAWSAEIL